MALCELGIKMSSPEACFQAILKEECFIELKAWRSDIGTDTNYQNLTILNTVSVLHNNSTIATSTMRCTFAHLSVLNMFIIIHALYLQIHRLETSSITPLDSAETASISDALQN